MSSEVANDDLWPDVTPIAIVTPSSILKTQAAALSRRTHGLLRGEVRTWATEGRGNDIYHQLELVVPALDDYHYSLLRIHHSVTPLYPVYVDESPLHGQDDNPSARPNPNIGIPQLRSEDAFRDWLRRALASDETKRILESLLAQATT